MRSADLIAIIPSLSVLVSFSAFWYAVLWILEAEDWATRPLVSIGRAIKQKIYQTKATSNLFFFLVFFSREPAPRVYGTVKRSDAL